MDEAPKAPITVCFNFKSRPLVTPPNLLRLEIAFRMAGVEEKEDAPEKKSDDKKPETVVLVECAHEVDYVLREGLEIRPQHAKAFKDGNAIFNAWPYFREYLQYNLHRMALPPLAALFLRLNQSPANERSIFRGEIVTEAATPYMKSRGGP